MSIVKDITRPSQITEELVTQAILKAFEKQSVCTLSDIVEVLHDGGFTKPSIGARARRLIKEHELIEPASHIGYYRLRK